jgi:23S rRNA (uracil1939-C5)-methyltransferase
LPTCLNIIFLLNLDSPRPGLNTRARQALIDLEPEKIIYTSCDPTTLAHNLKHLCESGYTLQSVHAFDLFPQTHYVETVASLVKATGKNRIE